MDPVPILLFAKAPRPGEIKTRLIPRLGLEGTVRLAETLAETAIAAAVASRIGPVSLWGTPDASHPFFRRMHLRHGVTLESQEGRDLGERMSHALGEALRKYPAALLAGTDLFHPTPELFQKAAGALDGKTREAVIVPSVDGGYVLIGLRQPCPQLFQGIAWGTPDVCAETLKRMEAQGLSYELFPPERDLDTASDYAEWLKQKPGDPLRDDGAA